MKERPILVSEVPVRGCLDGSKTQTRRLLKLRSGQSLDTLGTGERWPMDDESHRLLACPYGEPGDRLWVRETFQRFGGLIRYAADKSELPNTNPEARRFDYQLRPSIHMPRWASRLTLEVTGVRVERLCDISEADAEAEGCSAVTLPEEWIATQDAGMGGGELISLHKEPSPATIAELGLRNVRHNPACVVVTARDQFETLWESINGAGSWAKNPWVWVVSFRRLS